MPCRRSGSRALRSATCARSSRTTTSAMRNVLMDLEHPDAWARPRVQLADPLRRPGARDSRSRRRESASTPMRSCASGWPPRPCSSRDGVYMRSRWSPLDAEHVAEVGGHMGVYQLASPDGRDRVHRLRRRSFGASACAASSRAGSKRPDARKLMFRIEITTTYLSRYKELLMAHVAQHGSVPIDNSERHRGPRAPEPRLGAPAWISSFPTSSG